MTVSDVVVVVDGRRALVRWSRPDVKIDRPPLVLVPGCGRDQADFDPLVAALALSRVEVLVVPLPGRSGVEGPVPSSSSEAAAFVRAVLRTAGVRRVVIGGHSWGGAVALELALRAQDVDDDSVDDDDVSVAGLALLSTGARLRVAQAVFDHVEAAGDVTALADWRACDRFDRLADVHRVAVKTTIVVGADDVLTPPRYGRFLHERIAGSTLAVIEGAGHEAPSTHAVDVADALLPLLGVGSERA